LLIPFSYLFLAYISLVDSFRKVLQKVREAMTPRRLLNALRKTKRQILFIGFRKYSIPFRRYCQIKEISSHGAACANEKKKKCSEEKNNLMRNFIILPVGMPPSSFLNQGLVASFLTFKYNERQ